MIKIIIKKENEEKCTSYKEVKVYKHKNIFLSIYILYLRLKGYEVEILEDYNY